MPGTTTRARELRKNATKHEVILWSRLKRLRAEGYHFRRQAPMLGYYLDFVCLKHGLVVELDGSQHRDGLREQVDRTRDEALERAGLQVLRFPNWRVGDQLDSVEEEIWHWLHHLPARW